MLQLSLVLLVALAPPPRYQAAPSSVAMARVTCKQVSSCEEAVEIWCNGYGRADGDSDGIPCENVCHSIDEVEEVRARQGC